MKLLIVDDHAIVREGLAAMLRLVAPDTDVLQARDGAEGLALASAHLDIDAVFLDLEMPGTDGMAIIPELGRLRPDLPVIVLSSSENPQDVRRALGLGALGYVPKSAASQTLLSALQLVLSGNIYVPPLMLHATSAAGAAGDTAASATRGGRPEGAASPTTLVRSAASAIGIAPPMEPEEGDEYTAHQRVSAGFRSAHRNYSAPIAGACAAHSRAQRNTAIPP